MSRWFYIFYFVTILKFSYGVLTNELTELVKLRDTEVKGNFSILGLKLHNELREKHGVPPLELNRTLSIAALGYAHHLIRSNTFTNQLQPGYVKNLYQYRGKTSIDVLDAMEHAVARWYATIQNYNWTDPGVTPFSAMVWKGSTQVGFGIRQRRMRTVVVAAYSPPGNLLGEDGIYFKENVFRSLF